MIEFITEGNRTSIKIFNVEEMYCEDDPTDHNNWKSSNKFAIGVTDEEIELMKLATVKAYLSDIDQLSTEKLEQIENKEQELIKQIVEIYKNRGEEDVRKLWESY